MPSPLDTRADRLEAEQARLQALAQLLRERLRQAQAPAPPPHSSPAR